MNDKMIRDWLGGAGILLVWILYASQFLFTGLPVVDGAYSFQHAREIIAGKVMYLDILPHIPPITIAIQSAWISVLGDALWVERCHYLVINGLNYLIVYLCLLRVFPRTTAFFCTLPALSMTGALLNCFAWYNYDATFFYLLGTFVFLFMGSSAATSLASGLLIGLALLTKTNFGAIAILLIAGQCVILREWKSLLVFASGLSISLGAAAVWLFANQAATEFASFVLLGQAAEKGGLRTIGRAIRPIFDQTDPAHVVAFAVGYYLWIAGRNRWMSMLGCGLWLFGTLGGSAPLIWNLYTRVWVMALFVIIILIRKGKKYSTGEPRKLWALGIMAAGLQITDSLSQNAAWIHNSCSILALPFLLAMASKGAVSLHGRRLVPMAVASLILFSLGAIEKNPLPDQRTSADSSLRLLQAPDHEMTEYELVLERVRREETSILPGDSSPLFFAYPEIPSLYAATGTLSPTRLLSFPRTFLRSTAVKFDEDEKKRLEKLPPRIVVFLKMPRQPGPPPAFSPDAVMDANEFHAVSRWILSEYELESDLTRFAILKRRAK